MKVREFKNCGKFILFKNLKEEKKSKEDIRNEFFIENIYNPYRWIFKSWGYKFSKSVGLSVKDTEMEAIKIALEQTDIRMDGEIDSTTVPNILHATKQRLINLCNRKSAQKRNNYNYKDVYICKCGREYYSKVICECGEEITEENLQSVKVKMHEVSLENLSDGKNSSDDPDSVGFSYSREYINSLAPQEERLFYIDLVKQIRDELSWRFKTKNMTDKLLLIYDLLIEENHTYKDICRLLKMEDSTFYLYRSRITEAYYSVINRLNKKFAKKSVKICISEK